eukprot:CAMPEP_0183578284 /NCGR_PEP_ID=MMETSP0371-20130417/141515_1 /TAXON_ID=268820 /ORGANISM="Peridinium aciculiferum, Strain PAER-2" /LENGTH=201 /DNA_ID=CAMNT_0025788695 /DNA_START=1 /DNA_END=603 /DNA_ORIENTATION=+
MQLALLSTSCRRVQASAASPLLIAKLATQKGAPQTFWTLRGLALYDEFEGLGENHVRFQAGAVAMTLDSVARLEALATWMLRCRGLTAEVHAHVGGSGVANHKWRRMDAKESCSRADAVAHFLESRGVDADRINATGWGTAITGLAGTPMPADDIRTEVFLTIDDLGFPLRPAYYEGVTPPPQLSSRLAKTSTCNMLTERP